MIVVGLDPGSRSPAHVTFEDGKVTHMANVPTGRADVVFIEGQHVREKTSKIALMVLSKYAGLHAGYYLATGATVYELPVDDWREAVLPRSRSLSKDIFQSRLRAHTPSTVVRAGPDYVDAYWIAMGGLALQKCGATLLRLDWLKRTKRK